MPRTLPEQRRRLAQQPFQIGISHELAHRHAWQSIARPVSASDFSSSGSRIAAASRSDQHGQVAHKVPFRDAPERKTGAAPGRDARFRGM
jgi:predicted SprT family Zn-dependent metalloprotease